MTRIAPEPGYLAFEAAGHLYAVNDRGVLREQLSDLAGNRYWGNPTATRPAMIALHGRLRAEQDADEDEPAPEIYEPAPEA